MTTRELIEELEEADRSGEREVGVSADGALKYVALVVRHEGEDVIELVLGG